MDDQHFLTVPLLAGFIGLGIGWLIFGFFFDGVVLAIISAAIGIVAFGVGYLVMKIKGQ